MLDPMQQFEMNKEAVELSNLVKQGLFLHCNAKQYDIQKTAMIISNAAIVLISSLASRIKHGDDDRDYVKYAAIQKRFADLFSEISGGKTLPSLKSIQESN